MRFPSRRELRSRFWFRLRAVLAIAGLGLVLIAQPAVAQNATSTAATGTPGVIGTPPATSTCSATATPDASTIATTYTIANGSSNAQYEAEEQLAGKGANTAIGKTNAFIGSFYFDKSGKPIACSRWYVDLRTLKSDEARRDNFLYSNTLETETYPLATFTLTSVDGLTAPLADGKETSLTLVGELNLHGVTKLVSWSAKVTLKGDEIIGTADTSFDMPDFNIQPPRVGPVLSLDEHVKLHVDIVAKKS